MLPNLLALLTIYIEARCMTQYLWSLRNGRYTYTDKNGEKYQVPIQRVFSLTQLHEGDHVVFPGQFYCHHALVEYVDTERGEIGVIEYSNTFEEFLQDHSSSPINPGLAEVKRGRYKLEDDDVYLIKYKDCLDAETAISRARSRLGEREYNLFSNNCEHLVVWCKTGVSSSQQGERARTRIDYAAGGFVFAWATLGLVLIIRFYRHR